MKVKYGQGDVQILRPIKIDRDSNFEQTHRSKDTTVKSPQEREQKLVNITRSAWHEACRRTKLTHRCFLLQEAKAHREKELKKAEEDLNKAKKKAEESTKSMKEKQQVVERD